MKRTLVILGGIMAVCQNVAPAAVAVKKAATVTANTSAATEPAGSLLPSVLNLVSSVQQLSKQTKELTA